MHLIHPHLTLRTVVPGDLDFLRRLYASTREDELLQTGWPVAQIQQFLAMQFDAQHHAYSSYPDTTFQIIEHDGTPIGRIYLQTQADALHVVDLSLLANARGRGYGTTLLNALFTHAAAQGKITQMHVERFNPALRLYLRLGLQICEDQGVYLLLRRPMTTPVQAVSS